MLYVLYRVSSPGGVLAFGLWAWSASNLEALLFLLLRLEGRHALSTLLVHYAKRSLPVRALMLDVLDGMSSAGRVLSFWFGAWSASDFKALLFLLLGLEGRHGSSAFLIHNTERTLSVSSLVLDMLDGVSGAGRILALWFGAWSAGDLETLLLFLLRFKRGHGSSTLLIDNTKRTFPFGALVLDVLDRVSCPSGILTFGFGTRSASDLEALLFLLFGLEGRHGSSTLLVHDTKRALSVSSLVLNVLDGMGSSGRVLALWLGTRSASNLEALLFFLFGFERRHGSSTAFEHGLFVIERALL